MIEQGRANVEETSLSTDSEPSARSLRPWPARIEKRICALAVAIALAAGTGLRVVKLEKVPPGFDQDEACDGYDAFSILTTGRDHHGNFLPLVVQGFNDYRMPLFDYSLIPLVGMLGLRPAAVRLGAAAWGSADLAGIAIAGGLLAGWPAAAAAAILGALQPWHLTISRYGIEGSAASATITWAMVCFLLWLRRARNRWLLLSALFFGLSLYSYSITKIFTPLIVGTLTLLYWKSLKRSSRAALAALGIVLVLATPEILLLLAHRPEMQAQFNNVSLFSYLSKCPRCDPAQAAVASYSLLARAGYFAVNWAAYFTPSFLFTQGDRGDHWILLHPPGFGQLLPEQAPLLALALAGLFLPKRRRMVVLLLAWLMIAALPAALTVPQGAWTPELLDHPTPWILLDHSLFNVPLTPAMLLDHPDSRRGLLAMAPWSLLSAIGFVVLLDLTARQAVVRITAIALLAAGVLFHGARFMRSYFIDYPVIAAPYFQYGMSQVVKASLKYDDGRGGIVITDRVNQPYIYVLFFGHYPPARFQHQSVLYGSGISPPPARLFAPVLLFDHYIFTRPERAYEKLLHGVFVFAGNEPPPVKPELIIRYPNGNIAYSIVVK